MLNRLSKAESEKLLSLTTGTRVTAYCDRHAPLRGTVHEVAPQLGVLWIHTHSGERRLLELPEYTIHEAC